MQQINGYWVDENNNRWDCEKYTKIQAREYSATLINCYGCDNCCNCFDCWNCVDCFDCRSCKNCWYCAYCLECEDLCNALYR